MKPLCLIKSDINLAGIYPFLHDIRQVFIHVQPRVFRGRNHFSLPRHRRQHHAQHQLSGQLFHRWTILINRSILVLCINCVFQLYISLTLLSWTVRPCLVWSICSFKYTWAFLLLQLENAQDANLLVRFGGRLHQRFAVGNDGGNDKSHFWFDWLLWHHHQEIGGEMTLWF